MLERLAASRGTALEAVAEAAPRYWGPDKPWTADELATGAWGGFGSAVDEVLHLDADEREAVLAAFRAELDDLRRASFPPTDEEGGRPSAPTPSSSAPPPSTAWRRTP